VDAADAILSQLLKLDFALLTSDLYGGLAGIGIYLMDEAERRPTAEIQQAIASIRDVMARRLDEAPLPEDIHHLLSVLRWECGMDSALSHTLPPTELDDEDDWDDDDYDVETIYVRD